MAEAPFVVVGPTATAGADPAVVNNSLLVGCWGCLLGTAPCVCVSARPCSLTVHTTAWCVSRWTDCLSTERRRCSQPFTRFLPCCTVWRWRSRPFCARLPWQSCNVRASGDASGGGASLPAMVFCFSSLATLNPLLSPPPSPHVCLLRAFCCPLIVCAHMSVALLPATPSGGGGARWDEDKEKQTNVMSKGKHAVGVRKAGGASSPATAVSSFGRGRSSARPSRARGAYTDDPKSE